MACTCINAQLPLNYATSSSINLYIRDCYCKIFNIVAITFDLLHVYRYFLKNIYLSQFTKLLKQNRPNLMIKTSFIHYSSTNTLRRTSSYDLILRNCSLKNVHIYSEAPLSV